MLPTTYMNKFRWHVCNAALIHYISSIIMYYYSYIYMVNFEFEKKEKKMIIHGTFMQSIAIAMAIEEPSTDKRKCSNGFGWRGANGALIMSAQTTANKNRDFVVHIVRLI